MGAIQFHNLPLSMWQDDMNVGLTGAFLCCQVFGYEMEKQKSGVIINISSDYGIISPNQNIYRKEGVAEEDQTIKPVSYSVVKHGIMGLTKYLANLLGQKGCSRKYTLPGEPSKRTGSRVYRKAFRSCTDGKNVTPG